MSSAGICFIFSLLLSKYEFPAIRKIQELAKIKPNAKFLYFHTKGASYSRRFDKETVRNMEKWRHFLNFFNIENWQECVGYLDSYDACGVDWIPDELGNMIFAGNFWWANGSYINKCSLDKPYLNQINERNKCEEFIGTANGKVKVLKYSANEKLNYFFTPLELKQLTFKTHPSANNLFFFFQNGYYDEAFYREEIEYEIIFLVNRIYNGEKVEESKQILKDKIKKGEFTAKKLNEVIRNKKE